MSFTPRDYLQHILVEANYVIDHSKTLTVEQFLVDPTLMRAFVRSLEVIGEAAKKVPESWRARFPTVEWRAMTGMRDRLIHGYFGVDYELVYDVCKNKLPELKKQLDHLVELDDL